MSSQQLADSMTCSSVPSVTAEVDSDMSHYLATVACLAKYPDTCLTGHRLPFAHTSAALALCMRRQMCVLRLGRMYYDLTWEALLA